MAHRRLLVERPFSDRGREDRKEGGGEGKSLAAVQGERRGGEGTDARSQQMEIPARELPRSCAGDQCTSNAGRVSAERLCALGSKGDL